MTDTYPRDPIGYGRQTPDPKWPGRARIAARFVINDAEGGESCIPHGDPASEAFPPEIAGHGVKWIGYKDFTEDEDWHERHGGSQ